MYFCNFRFPSFQILGLGQVIHKITYGAVHIIIVPYFASTQIITIICVLWVARMLRIIDFPSPSLEEFRKVRYIQDIVGFLGGFFSFLGISFASLLCTEPYLWTGKHSETKVMTDEKRLSLKKSFL